MTRMGVSIHRISTNAQEKSKSTVTFCPATTHILNVTSKQSLMKIEHISDNYSLLWDWCFQTNVNELPRYHTLVDYYNYKYTITDRWTGEEFVKEGFNNEKDIYTEVEKIAKTERNNSLQKKIIEFYKNKKTEFNDTLKDELFDAWLYNTNIYSQISKMENISDSYIKREKETRTTFNECLKYYYERTTNTIKLLDTSDVIMHKHFWISMDYEGSEIKKMILKHFGKNIYEGINNDHFYFDRKCFDMLMKKNNELKTTDNILTFKRLIAESWLGYINKHFLIPISFANRNYYD